MLRVCTILCATASLCATAGLCTASEPPDSGQESWAKTLSQARENVLEQLRQSTNYTCTEVLDRTYYYTAARHDASCAPASDNAPKHPYMHDRLRLDVAVSRGSEIFSWHGGDKFTSSGVETVVRTGTVSSGSFVGYLRNIFETGGVKIQYAGHFSGTAGEKSLFNYDVPLASSDQNLQVKGRKVVVPFHGSFAVDDRTLQLASLDVVIDKTPPNSDICYASMEILYQLSKISDRLALTPQLFLLNLNVAEHQSSSSRTTFTDCHAFRGESTIHYTDLDDGKSTASNITAVRELPEHVRLHATITTPIDGKTSYTGDAVEGTLLSPVAVRGTDISLRKGATLKGVITKLEYHYLPTPHYLLSIRFDALTDGQTSYRFNSVLQTPEESKSGLMSLYGVKLEELATREGGSGEILFAGQSLHVPRHTSATWITTRSGGE